MLDIRNPEIRPYAFDGNFGLEREALRVTGAGRMAQTPHPFPPDHPRIVRDFCAQIAEKAMAPTPVLSPGKPHGRRSLMGCSPWGRYESDRTERLPFHFLLSWKRYQQEFAV